MYVQELRSKIEIEQRRQLNNSVFALVIIFFSVIFSSVAPQMMYEYLLQGVSVEQQLMLLQYIPLASYLVAFVAFAMTVFGHFSHRRRVRLYEQEMMLLEYTQDDCNCGHEHHSHHAHADLTDLSDTDFEIETEEVIVEATPEVREGSVADLSAALSNANAKAMPKKSVSSSKKRGRSAGKKSSKK